MCESLWCGTGAEPAGNRGNVGNRDGSSTYPERIVKCCVRNGYLRAVAKRTYEAAVELFAMLCKQYGLNPLADGVVISHAEGHKRGIASNHGDSEHLWKGLGMCYTMNGFRQDVKKTMDGSSSAATKPSDEYYRVRKSWADKKSQLGAYKVLTNAKKKADENLGYFVFDEDGKVVYPVEEKAFEPYMVKVSIENLNIRRGPGTNYPKVGRYTGRGVFTIVEEADGEALLSGDS